MILYQVSSVIHFIQSFPAAVLTLASPCPAHRSVPIKTLHGYMQMFRPDHPQTYPMRASWTSHPPSCPRTKMR